MDISRRAICSLVAVAAFATLSTAAAARTLNGFDLKDSLVPPDQILPGGPGRDGIPAIDAPKFVKASAANLAAADRVLGLVHNGAVKAYPVRILNWHEIVNDRFGVASSVVAETRASLPHLQLLLLGINNETDGLGIRWSRRAVDLLFGVGYPDPRLQAKLFCPTRITSIIEGQPPAARPPSQSLSPWRAQPLPDRIAPEG